MQMECEEFCFFFFVLSLGYYDNGYLRSGGLHCNTVNVVSVTLTLTVTLTAFGCRCWPLTALDHKALIRTNLNAHMWSEKTFRRFALVNIIFYKYKYILLADISQVYPTIMANG